MKPNNKSFKVVFLVVSLLLACNEEDPSINSALDSYNPLEGIWERKNYTPGFKDTVITFYEFSGVRQFEYGQTRFRYGQYEETLYKGGSYTIPVSGLLLLSYEYKRQGNQYTPISQNDTLVFTMENIIDLILWGTTRTFKQISGQPGKLWQGTYYNVTKHFDVYIHSKFEFKEDSAYFSSTLTPEFKEPAEWPEPFKYWVTTLGALMTFYTNDGRAVSNGYALYNSNLIFTYTRQRYRVKY
jgi:hypothetical protein